MSKVVLTPELREAVFLTKNLSCTAASRKLGLYWTTTASFRTQMRLPIYPLRWDTKKIKWLERALIIQIPRKKIAAALGISPRTLGYKIDYLRQQGKIDVPAVSPQVSGLNGSRGRWPHSRPTWEVAGEILRLWPREVDDISELGRRLGFKNMRGTLSYLRKRGLLPAGFARCRPGPKKKATGLKKTLAREAGEGHIVNAPGTAGDQNAT